MTAIREWTFPRHADLPDTGPWATEPDKVQWVDESTNLDCLMLRNRSGAWCGYVGVPEDHPLYRHGYYDYENDDAPVNNINIHGGLTFADFCQDRKDTADAICHVPYPGRPDNVWWLGFDTAHLGDICPVTVKIAGPFDWGDTYKDRAYVEAEVISLAKQLKELMSINFGE